MDHRMDAGAMKGDTIVVEEAPPGRRLGLGHVVVAVMVLGLATWIAVRISAALQVKAQVERDRAAAAERSRAGRAAPAAPELVKGAAATWSPQVPVDGTLYPTRE